MDGASECLHATAIAVDGKAVLLRGPSGSGKSDLALRTLALTSSPMIAGQIALIADDRVIVNRSENSLFATSPAAIRGKIEVRGLGIFELPSLDNVEIGLVCDLVPGGPIDRLPDPVPSVQVLGVSLPLLRLNPFEASAPLKLVLALCRYDARRDCN